MSSAGKPKIAFVIQRYGTEIGGGSEFCCRQVAERLSRYYDIEILTTCALDHFTWKNHYPAGRSTVNGIAVRRFPVAAERDRRRFSALEKKIFWAEHPEENERDLLRAQGPYAPALLDYIEAFRDSYDAFLFFTYLYHPTCMGLPLVGSKGVFLPTAHDEHMLYLRYFDRVFHATPHLLFLSEEEKFMVQRRFLLPEGVGRVCGMGIDPPDAGAEDPAWATVKEKLGGSRTVVYVGRIEGGKGCDQMVEYFLRFVQESGRDDVKLLLLGKQAMAIPDHPAVVAPGYVSEYVKARALASATVMIAPSAYESLCIAALEGWYHACPLMANGHSAVLVGHCLRSNGGLWYTSYEEFGGVLSRFLEDRGLGAALGRQGREYVAARYRWEEIEKVYCEVLDAAIAQARDAVAAPAD